MKRLMIFLFVIAGTFIIKQTNEFVFQSQRVCYYQVKEYRIEDNAVVYDLLGPDSSVVYQDCYSTLNETPFTLTENDIELLTGVSNE